MKVVFLGNHTVGVRALQAISESAEVAGVVAHPPDPEDGVRYESVGCFAERKRLEVDPGESQHARGSSFHRDGQARPSVDYGFPLSYSTGDDCARSSWRRQPASQPASSVSGPGDHQLANHQWRAAAGAHGTLRGRRYGHGGHHRASELRDRRRSGYRGLSQYPVSPLRQHYAQGLVIL